ncbi:repressor LexA [Candidatus Marinamargulisbacteria bacterium SCGC AG-343-D04]|nr:repressor LexA [Candidatus Marinamargulisbacteria bacterium SCGC AG-343-D04]
MLPLTSQQKEVFEFLCSFYNKHHHCPTYKEIAKAFNFSSDGTVRTYLEYLEKKGYIQRQKKARSIIIKHNPFQIPIMGTIHAGNPSEAIENIENTLQDLPLLSEKKNKFGLKIKGDSMIEAGIHENDIAIIDTSLTVKNANIVAAIINGEATLKRFYKRQKHIELIPENNRYSSIIIEKKDSSDCILGKCVGIIRSF